MSCEKCDNAQKSGQVYYFRWKTANIALLGCQEHIKEVIEQLRKYKDGEKSE